MKASASARKVFAHNLRTERERAGLTQAELERKSGILRTSISALEGGKQNATLDTIERLAKALGIEASHLLDGV